MSQFPTPPAGPPYWGRTEDASWSPAAVADPAAAAPAGLPWRRLWGRSTWLIGVVVLLVGTFLPWLYSGRVAKNSYQLAGVGQRRLAVPPWAEIVLGGWTFLGPLWAILAVLYLVRLQRVSAALAVALALIIGLTAGTVVVLTAGLTSQYVSAALLGPIITTVGAILAAVGAGADLRRRR